MIIPKYVECVFVLNITEEYRQMTLCYIVPLTNTVQKYIILYYFLVSSEQTF